MSPGTILNLYEFPALPNLDINIPMEEIPPALGFHVPGRFDKVFQVDDCLLADDFSNNIRNSIFEFCIAKKISFYNLRSNEGMMRNLIIRSTTLNQKLVIVIFAKDEKEIIEEVMKHIAENFPETTSLNFAINAKLNDSMEGIDVEKK